MHQEYVTSFFGIASKRVNPALPSVRFEWLLFKYYSEMFLFFHADDTRILVEYTYSFLRLIFNTAHSSLITAQMGSVTPLF